MQLLRQNNAADILLVTLNEKSVLPAPYYIFVFTNVTTKEVVTFALTAADDISTATQRYNEFLINTGVLFLGKAVGQWRYEIYESSTPIFSDGLNMLENGKMLLQSATTTVRVGYNTPSTITGYAG